MAPSTTRNEAGFSAAFQPASDLPSKREIQASSAAVAGAATNGSRTRVAGARDAAIRAGRFIGSPYAQEGKATTNRSRRGYPPLPGTVKEAWGPQAQDAPHGRSEDMSLEPWSMDHGGWWMAYGHGSRRRPAACGGSPLRSKAFRLAEAFLCAVRLAPRALVPERRRQDASVQDLPPKRSFGSWERASASSRVATTSAARGRATRLAATAGVLPLDEGNHLSQRTRVLTGATSVAGKPHGGLLALAQSEVIGRPQRRG